MYAAVYHFLSVLNALQGILLFYDSEYKSIDVDGLIGLRIIEGQLKHILIDYGKDESFLSLKKKSFGLLTELIYNASLLANKAVPFVFEKDPAYFSSLQKLVSVPWSVTGARRLTNEKLVWEQFLKNDFESAEQLKESKSDSCFAELTSSQDCNHLSRSCLDYMLKPKSTTGYSLNHQVLFASAAQIFYCEKRINTYLKEELGYKNGIDDFLDETCSNLFYQFKHMTTLDKFNHDLFLETIFSCGSIGYFEFANIDHLNIILDWQDPVRGCYTRSIQKVVFNENLPVGRKWLRDSTFENGCSTHVTSVACGALAFYLRFLVNFGPEDLVAAGFGPDAAQVSTKLKNQFWQRPTFTAEDYVHFVSLKTKKLKKGGVEVNVDDELTFSVGLPPHFGKIDKTIFASFFMMAIFLLVICYTLWASKLTRMCPTRRKLFRR